MSKAISYNLVHITTSGEYKAPLVASQLFDQAECQAIDRTNFAPLNVSAWILTSMREIFNSDSKTVIDRLRKRCPHVDISFVGGVDRFNSFPMLPAMIAKRIKLGKAPVIYHCRGEDAAQWAARLKKIFRSDKIVFDVRGFWPAELLYRKHIYDPALATGSDLEDYTSAENTLRKTIRLADVVTTVSRELKELLLDNLDARSDTYVVPCCVMKTTGDNNRNKQRAKWGVKDDETVLVYSGTAAQYQHLSDLTLPFVKELMARNEKIRLVILTPDIDKVKNMLAELGMSHKVYIDNLPQSEVAEALTGADAGLLIRKPSLVNKVANPVKIAEYMASGLSLIVEKGIGGISDNAYLQKVAKPLVYSDMNEYAGQAEGVVSWLAETLGVKRNNARKIVEEEYAWPSAIHTHRKAYQSLLVKN